MAAALALAASCHSASKQPKPRPVSWRAVGSWSGRGNAQTDSFDIDYAPCRIRWDARNETARGAGKLHITVNSSVSGRELATPVDHQGAGHDLVYVNVDPHYSYLVIQSSNEDWSVTVEELLPSP